MVSESCCAASDGGYFLISRAASSGAISPSRHGLKFPINLSFSGKSTLGTQSDTASPSRPIEVFENGEFVLAPAPKRLPTDRPFGNLLPADPALPPRFATILNDRSPAKLRAERLRQALRTENQMLGSYVLLLLLLGSLACFYAVGGTTHLSALDNFQIPFTWELWSFTLPGSAACVITLYDAFKTISDFDGEHALTEGSPRIGGENGHSAIRLHQHTVQMVDVELKSEKKAIYRLDA